MSEPQFQSLRQSRFLFPAFFGVLFVGVILILAIVIRDPTKFQFEVFRIVLALAGAGLVSTLTDAFELRLPILERGYIKGGAAIVVFALLFFFSPASLFADDSRLRVEALRAEYDNPTSEVNRATAAIEQLWESDDAQKLFEANEPPTTEARTALAAFATKTLEPALMRSNYRTVVDFLLRIADCTSDGSCDQQSACTLFAEDIEEFRQLYCGVIIDLDNRNGDTVWQRLEDFAIAKCWPEFVNVYVPRQQHDFFANRVCIPTECWSTNLSSPPACLIERQFTKGLVIPARAP
jgi:hypothetical protein